MRGLLDGRVVVVTGAGGGIGRAHALAAAAEGARVVVNDIGVGLDGSPAGGGSAAQGVVDEITAAGGHAVADGSDVADWNQAAGLIATAVDTFGGLDVLVNNAGIVRWAGFPEVDADNLERHLAVHVGGSFHTTRAAWPHMVAQGYGRIVLTTSTGVLGLPDNTSYATAKAAVIGLARSCSRAGAAHGIKVNCVAPVAFTRMAGGPGGTEEPAREDPRAVQMAPGLVAPLVGLLAHERCPVSGEIYVAGAGRFTRLVLACTEGYVHRDGDPTIEDVAGHWDEVNDTTRLSVPADLMAWSRDHLRHLGDAG